MKKRAAARANFRCAKKSRRHARALIERSGVFPHAIALALLTGRVSARAAHVQRSVER
jgi:hypothetical protein